MNASRLHGRTLLRLIVCLFTLTLAPAALASDTNWRDWRPIDPAQLALKSSTIDPDADAEAIFWEVRVAREVESGGSRTVLDHYVRIKIFNDRGRESQGRVDILAPKLGWFETKINDVAGRTIRPDGQIVELKKEDIFERTIVKASGLKVKAESFAMPGVEPGSIIEYRWREVRGGLMSFYELFDFSRDIPVQSIKYYIKPLNLPNQLLMLRAQFFHAQMPPVEKEKEGYVSVTLRNVPAFHEEPNMPPERAVRPWMLLYYTFNNKTLPPQEFWKDYGRRMYDEHKADVKVSGEIKQKATELVGDATTPEQKLERLFEFCRTQVKNIYNDASGLTAEQREKARENKTPADTLKRGIGTSHDIDMLFAALATAAGFEARVAYLADRGDNFFDANFADSYFMRTYDIAVRVGDEWRFYDPASTYVPYGMLRWQEEGQAALLSDPKEPVFLKTPLSGPEKSLEKRTAKLKLGEDGTLEGDVRIEYTGHFAAELKAQNHNDSPAEREETLRNRFKLRLAGIEITDIKVENVNDPVKPFVYSFHARVPGYAQRTGKRLFLQPAFFQHGAAPLFAASDRKNDIYFHYSWSEEDRVEIELPQGFALDHAESPAPFSSGKLSSYEPKASVTTDGRTLLYTRKFFFDPRSNGGFVIFPAASYQQLKGFFDTLHQQDNHTISLKQSAATAETKSTN